MADDAGVNTAKEVNAEMDEQERSEVMMLKKLYIYFFVNLKFDCANIGFYY